MEGQFEMAWILIDSLQKIMKVFSVKSQKKITKGVRKLHFSVKMMKTFEDWSDEFFREIESRNHIHSRVRNIFQVRSLVASYLLHF